MGRRKISVIGAGNVGGSVAQRLLEKNRYDVVLVDIVEGLPQGKALDLAQANTVGDGSGSILGTNGYDESADSSVVVIVSGMPRKPGMSRDELLKVNTKIIQSVVPEVVDRSPAAILVIVTNPLDAMTYVAHRVSRFPKPRVVGMAGILDSARFRSFIAQELNVSVDNVQAMVWGGHGDFMVPLVRYTTVAGRPLGEWMSQEMVNTLVERTRNGGAEILHLLKTGSAFYAPSSAIVEMVEAIMMDQKKILPCATLCEGEYGLNGLFMGVPVKLGAGGAEEIVVYDLTTEEQAALEQSATSVEKLCQQADRLLS